jgi:hypothetical protein
MKLRSLVFLVLFSFAFASVPLFAQAVEINPYAAFSWPGNNNQVGGFKSNQLLGVRGGGYVTPNFEIGGNYSWNNHFQPNSANTAATFAGDLGFPQGTVRANLWEAEFTYNFGKRSMFGSSAARPYLVAGAGGLTTSIKNSDQFVLNVVPVVTPFGNAGFVANDVLDSGDTFFTFSYGGGIKLMRLWGPMGFFGDFRGRAIPNFFQGHGTNIAELSAGLNFSWGEK